MSSKQAILSSYRDEVTDAVAAILSAEGLKGRAFGAQPYRKIIGASAPVYFAGIRVAVGCDETLAQRIVGAISAVVPGDYGFVQSSQGYDGSVEITVHRFDRVQVAR